MQDFIPHAASAFPDVLCGKAGAFDLRGASDQLRQVALALDEHERTVVDSRQEAALAQRRAQDLAALGALASGVAHDFNNLLHVLNGSLDRLGASIAGNASAERQVGYAQAASRRCGQLASQLLTLGRRVDTDATPFDPTQMLEEIVGLLRQAAGEGIEVRLEVAPGVWRVQADRAQLEDALLNLTINARDAMDGQGVLILRLANTPSDCSGGDQVCLAVIDTGCGMSPQTALQAVQPFFSTKPSGKGAGLGLAMVDRFVKAAGGQLQIHSAPGRGTKIEILLPRAADQDAAAEGEALTVLLAKTDTAERHRLAAELAARNYRVLAAASSREALGLVEAGGPFDLLVADLDMPGRVRAQCLLRRARDRRPDLGVVFTAPRPAPFDAHALRAEPSMFFLSGVDVLHGPCSVERLDRKLREVRSQVVGGRARVILVAPSATSGPPR